MKRKMSGRVTTPSAKRHSTGVANAETSNESPGNYPKLEILGQPAHYQHVRMFSDLESGVCPLIQAVGKDSSEPVHMRIKVMNNIYTLEVD